MIETSTAGALSIMSVAARYDYDEAIKCVKVIREIRMREDYPMTIFMTSDYDYKEIVKFVQHLKK